MFHFHENPNKNCPVGRNIHLAMDDKLREIQTGMEDQMKKITIADVAAEIHKAVKYKHKADCRLFEVAACFIKV